MTARELAARARVLLAAAGLSTEVKERQEKFCDSYIEFGDTGIGVSVSMETPKALVELPQLPYYTPFISYQDPGVWRYPDGSGEPPSEEVADLDVPQLNADFAIAKAVEVLVRLLIQRHLDLEADRAHALDLEADRLNDR